LTFTIATSTNASQMATVDIISGESPHRVPFRARLPYSVLRAR
jgi:hypothetical protein